MTTRSSLVSRPALRGRAAMRPASIDQELDSKRLGFLHELVPKARGLAALVNRMVQARMTAVVRRLASSVPFGEGLNLSDKMMTSIPPEQIGRMMSGLEAAELILRLVQGRGRPRE
jgi:hypothetical protein